MRRSILILILCVSAIAATAAAEKSLLDDALVVIQANDLLWCDRHIAGYSAAANLDPTEHRNLLAEVLFHSRKLDGMDLSRPALVGWLDRPASFMAVVPILDRRLFLEHFGADTRLGAPLVRVGERDGTTVYSHNTDGGLVEYRLLVQDDTAYLASTPQECRQLAAMEMQRIGDGAPLQVRMRGEALVRFPLRQIGNAPWLYQMSPSIFSLLSRYGSGQFDSIAKQISRIDLSINNGEQGQVVIDGRLLARSDADLARFLAVQKNQSSRLLPLVNNEHTAVAIYGSIAWQGELDRFGQELATVAQARLGSAWTAQAEDSWRRAWSARDRNGSFVAIADLERSDDKTLAINTLVLAEQAQAGDVVVHAQRFATAEQAVFATSQKGAVITDQSITDCSVAGLPGWHHQFRCNGHPVDYVQVATGRHVVSVESSIGQAEKTAQTHMSKVLLDGGQKPEGTSALIAGWIDVGVIARTVSNSDLFAAPKAKITFSAKTSTQGDLVLQVVIPLLEVAVLEREARTAMARPANQK